MSTKGGRNKDPVWDNFYRIEKDGKVSAKCKNCGREQSNKADRMKKHVQSCLVKSVTTSLKRQADILEELPSQDVTTDDQFGPASKRVRMQTDLQDSVLITSASTKKRLDTLVAKFFFACNIPFSVTEHTSFKELVQVLRPGYKPPTRKELSGRLLDTVTEELQFVVKQQIGGKECTLIEDGWSNCHNDPVTASCAHVDKQAFFIDARSTGSTSKTGENCKDMCKETIEATKKMYDCTVKNIVTDNAKNMEKMRELLHADDPDLLVYGCHAHWLNLLGQDITPSAITKHVVEIQKYFRNHHLPSAWLMDQSGSLKPQLPGETRWNSQLTCMHTFLHNRPLMIQVIEEHSNQIDSAIARKVNDYNIYKQVKDLRDQLKPVSDALTVADACDVWLSLINNPDLEMHQSTIKKRMMKAIHPFQLAAYLLHPKYKGQLLSTEMREQARTWIATRDETFISLVLAYEAESTPFPASFWTPSAAQMESHVWWKAVGKEPGIPAPFTKLMIRLQKLPASSASVERVFSNFSHIQSKVRNRLGVEKASKLVFCYRMLRGGYELDY